MFPTAKFECSGRILGLQGRAYFDTLSNDYYYNGTLVLSLQLWKEEQDHYTAPLQNHTVSLSTAQIDTAVASSNPRLFYFGSIRRWTFSMSLDEAIEVEAGDVLGIYLQPTGTVGDNVVVNSIPLGIADGPDIRVLGSTSCWSPQGRIVCHPLLSFTGLPLLSFEFERSPEVTSKLF